MDEEQSARERDPGLPEEGDSDQEVSAPIELEDWGEPPDADTPAEYAATVADLAVEDPIEAGDYVGDLVVIARDYEGARDAVREALDVIGWRRPAEFEVWSSDLADLAAAADDEVALIGMAALADLAATSPRVAQTGVDAALGRLTAQSTELRRAALAVVAEVGAEDPDAVTGADRHVAAAVGDADPAVRRAGTIAAGRLLEAAPGIFPRTAAALPDALADEDTTVHEYAHVAMANFARVNPANVPEKGRVMEALAAVSDDELGLRRGATDEALSELLAVAGDGDLPRQ